MNRTTFGKKLGIGWGLLTLVLVTASCRLNSNETRRTTLDSRQESQTPAFSPEVVMKKEALPPEEAESFTPSHTNNLALIERKDGDFDTPVDIKYQDPNGKIWKAPVGTITDGASIPGLFKSFFGGRLNKAHLFAAIVHDAYCAGANAKSPLYQSERWQDTHRMFYHACLSNGTSRVAAGTMYAAVRLAGPRWPFPGETFTSLSEVEDNVLLEEMKRCEDWIISKGDSLKLEEIDAWMDAREQYLLEKK